MPKANKQRGEITIKGPDGWYNLCLTLGAIAEIEEELGIQNLTEVDAVFQNPSMRAVLKILLALLHGGGHSELELSDMMAWEVDLKTLMRKIAETFKAAGFGQDEAEDEEESGNR